MNNVIRIKSSLVATGTATNAAATASVAAPAKGQRVYLTGYSASFSAAPAAPVALQIKQGSTVVATIYVSAPITREFSSPIECPPNTAASAVLGAGGSAVVGFANLEYYIA